jgi:hypothetical protein
MRLGTTSPVNVATTHKSGRALGTQMGRGVSEFGAIFKNKFPPFVFQG